jgi:hypothetical protein
MLVLASLRVRERRMGIQHPWRGLLTFAVILVGLVSPVTRGYLTLFGWITAELWLLPAVVLGGLALLAAAPIDRSVRPALTIAVACVVLLLLTLLALWSSATDGGPVYC